MAYIVCEKRRGHPKVNVEVCRRKCKFAEECKPYRSYLKAMELEESPLDVESQATANPHQEGAGKEVLAV